MDQAANGGMVQLLMLGGFVALFYFMLIRPQQKQQKERDKMLKALNVGDKVLTSGGIYGEITELKDKSIRVRIAKDVVIRMTRAGVQSVTSGSQDD